MESISIAQLPATIQTAFHPGFVFIITKDLVQHFPARGWTDQQILDNLFNRYQAKGTFKEAEGYRIVIIEGQPDLLIVVP